MRPDYRTAERECDAVELAWWISLLADHYTATCGREPTKVERAVVALEAQALAAADHAIDAMA